MNSLSSEVSRRRVGIPAQAVIHAGATNLKSLTTDNTVLRDLQACYSQAVTNVLYFALAALVIGMPFAIFMEWKTLKPPHTQEMHGGEHRGTEKLADSTSSKEAVRTLE